MKKAILVFCILLCSMAAGCGKKETTSPEKENKTEKETESEAESGNNEEDQSGIHVSVWLDAESEYLNRNVMGSYTATKKKVAGSDTAQYYTDIQWDLVDKSYLTPEQYRQELADALEKGEGPDLIFMDEYNGLSPQDMMASGSLAEIDDPADWYGEELEYFPGTMELGQQDGKQYVLPVSMQCPVLFGMEEDLQKAGIDTENGYGSLQELLEALLAAHEKTGRNILESTEAVDWLEQHYVDEEDAGTLELLAQARACCGNDDSVFAAYDALDSGTALLGGCGVADCRRIGQNLCLMPEDAQPSFIYIPAADGIKRAVISQSAGINAKSENRAEISRALFMYRYMINSMNTTGMVPIADDEYWDSNLNPYVYAASELYDKQYASRVSYLSGKTRRAFKKAVSSSIQDAVYAVNSQGERQSGQPEVQQPERKVITVYYEDLGLGADSEVTQWLQQSADGYNASQEEYYVQLLQTGEPLLNYMYSQMEAGGTEPDIVLFSEQEVPSYEPDLADMSGFLEQHSDELSFLPDSIAGGIKYGNITAGLPYAALEYGIWCNKQTLRSAGLSEDWKPKDMQELADGLRQLKKTEGIQTAAALDGDFFPELLFAFMVSDHLDTYLKQNSEGEWQVSAQAWAEFMEELQQLRDEELVVPPAWKGAGITEEEAAAGLVDGTVGAVLSDSTYGGWYDGAHGLELSDGQREQLIFVPLSPLAHVDVFCISANSQYQEAAAEFWLWAVSHESYAQLVCDDGMMQLMQLSETVQSAMPCQRGSASSEDIVNGLWPLGKTADEIAEEVQWFDSITE